tara:strand:+ start:2773 stop:2922 length:150 start_codon:yes stop_codon:yes gene_type:complete
MDSKRKDNILKINFPQNSDYVPNTSKETSTDIEKYYLRKKHQRRKLFRL